MKHQLIFVGGQLLPILVGIREFSPESIHFIISEESKDKIDLIKPFIRGKSVTENICNPFDFDSIKGICEKILNGIPEGEQIQFNLTGGTKIMVLVGQALITERNLTGFYINQDDSFLQLPSYNIKRLSCEITINEFLEISGHKLNSFKRLSDYSSEDFSTVEEIHKLSENNNKLLLQVNSKVRSQYDKLTKIPKSGNMDISKGIKLIWTDKSVVIEENSLEVFKIESQNVRSLFFHASWWEVIIAKEISNWDKAKELLIQCELPFKADGMTAKNEIDVLVNLGGKMIFIECKSGIVKQEDVNKMRIVKDTYGGVISKSLLVCRFNPTPNILEKCKELGIYVFCCYDGNRRVNQLNSLNKTLDILERKSTI